MITDTYKGNDEAMELLCSLSRRPAPMALLCEDHDLTEARLRRLVARLRARLFDVTFRGDSVYLTADGYARCKAAAEAYYERTYGN